MRKHIGKNGKLAAGASAAAKLLVLSLVGVIALRVGAAENNASQTVTRAGTVPSSLGSPEFFTGRVRVDMLSRANDDINASSAFVTFEPGARSAWHRHPKGQYLVVTAGAGLTQEWGKPVQLLAQGDVVWCPPNVKHWHGASPSSSLTHLALTGVSNDKSVEWMEKVSDEQYQSR